MYPVCWVQNQSNYHFDTRIIDFVLYSWWLLVGKFRGVSTFMSHIIRYPFLCDIIFNWIKLFLVYIHTQFIYYRRSKVYLFEKSFVLLCQCHLKLSYGVMDFWLSSRINFKDDFILCGIHDYFGWLLYGTVLYWLYHLTCHKIFKLRDLLISK